jgi:hypothetical protein
MDAMRVTQYNTLIPLAKVAIPDEHLLFRRLMSLVAEPVDGSELALMLGAE